MLTIGIPTYNYAIDTLVTHLQQQCEGLTIAYEIIVVDDASSNAELAKQNKLNVTPPYCRYLQHSSNKGRTAARATIAKEATYDWLLFFDADVLPQHEHLIEDYLKLAKPEVDAVFGGLTYEDIAPPAQETLRWKYGIAREVVAAQQRNKTPYVSVVSACFMIRKPVFNATNPHQHQGYGLDIHFANNLSREGAKVVHIDNPVVHLGLETNEQFLVKTKNGIETLARLTKENDIPRDYKALQRFYLRLKRFGMLGAFMLIMKKRTRKIEKNLTSVNPSLFWYDMFRVNEYAKQMKDA